MQATRSQPSNDGARDRSMAASIMPSNLRNTDSTSRRARRGSLRSRRENGRKLTTTSYFNARRASVAMPESGFRSRPTIMLIVMAPMSSINVSVISISSPARHPFWRARTCSTSMSSWTSLLASENGASRMARRQRYASPWSACTPWFGSRGILTAARPCAKSPPSCASTSAARMGSETMQTVSQGSRNRAMSPYSRCTRCMKSGKAKRRG